MIAGFELRDGVANLLNHSGAVIARRIRQRRQSRVRSRANVSLHRVNTDRVYSNKHFTRSGPRRRHFFQPKNFRPTEFVYSNCFHRS